MDYITCLEKGFYHYIVIIIHIHKGNYLLDIGVFYLSLFAAALKAIIRLLCEIPDCDWLIE